jgi:hypothetical protein
MKTYLPKCSSGAFLARVMRALRNWNQVDGVESTPIKKNAPQIKSGWDYRPKKAIRRHTAVQCAETETPNLLTPDVAKDKNDNVWIDDRWFEFTGHTCVNVDDVEAMVEKATMRASLSGHKNAVSEYD